MYVCMYVCVPYAWYIWRSLSLAIWEETGIGGHLVWRIRSSPIIDKSSETMLIDDRGVRE